MKRAPRWNEADHLTKAARDYERFLPYSRRENDQALLAPHGALQIPFFCATLWRGMNEAQPSHIEHSATKQLQH
jgi:hypothetical protein